MFSITAHGPLCIASLSSPPCNESSSCFEAGLYRVSSSQWNSKVSEGLKSRKQKKCKTLQEQVQIHFSIRFNITYSLYCHQKTLNDKAPPKPSTTKSTITPLCNYIDRLI